MEQFRPGVWVTTITAFDGNGKLDFKANADITNWCIKKGADGLFAVCQSSEMRFLTLQEKIDLAKCVLDAAAGRVPVVVSGHTAENMNEQINELGLMAETGADAVVMVTNRLATLEQGKAVYEKNLMRILTALPNVDFGLYECPTPFLRLLSSEEIRLTAQTNRVKLFKDVCGNAAMQEERGKIVKGTAMQLYNARHETLLNTMLNGYSGYCGALGNFHIDLYRWYYEHYQTEPVLAAKLLTFFCKACDIEKPMYPVSAKYHMNLEGVQMNLESRTKPASIMTDENKELIRKLKSEEDQWRKQLDI